MPKSRLTSTSPVVLPAIAAAAAAILFSRGAAATQPLGEFLRSAEAANFDARESVAITHQREAEADASLGRLLPTFTARGQYTRNQYEAAATLPGGPRIVITPRDQWDGILQLDVPIIDVAGHYRYSSSKALARASHFERGAVRQNAHSAVARTYYQFMAASALEQSAARSLSLAEENLKQVEARVAAGATTELDRSRAVANVERAKNNQADASLLVQLAARDLQTLSGLAPTPPQGYPQDDLHEEVALERWLAKSGTTPIDRAVKEASDAASFGHKAANSTLLPVLSGSAQQRFTNATGFAGNSSIYTLQVAATWRFDLATVGTARAQGAAAEVQSIRAERARRGVSDAIYGAHLRVATGIVKSRAARAQAEAAEKAAQLAADRYAAGAATQLEVTEAQRDAFLGQASRIQADADLAYARVALRLAAGLPASHEGAP